VGVKFKLNFVPVGEVNVGVVAFGFGNSCNLIDEGNGGVEIFELEVAHEFFACLAGRQVFNHLPFWGYFRR